MLVPMNYDNIAFYSSIYYLMLMAFFVVLLIMEHMCYFYQQKSKACRSSRNLNYGLSLFNLGALFLLPITALPLAYICGSQGLTLLNISQLSLVLQIIIWYVIIDFFQYVAHFLAHHTPLWVFHKIHHSDKHMNVTTTFRFHPFDFHFANLMKMSAIPLFGPDWFVVLFINPLHILVGIFAHSNIRLPRRIDVYLSKVITTPRYHYIHHVYQTMNKNLAVGLTFWDKLFQKQVKLADDSIIEGYQFGFQNQQTYPNFKDLIITPFVSFKKKLRPIPKTIIALVAILMSVILFLANDKILYGILAIDPLLTLLVLFVLCFILCKYLFWTDS